MHPVVNHLIQLQELNLIRDEQKVHGNTAHLDQLDQSIKTMAAELPKDILVQYDKLRKKDQILIVPASDGVCAGCGMRLPISLVQAIRLGRSVQNCPNCAKMLYTTDTAPRRMSRPVRRSEQRKLGVARFSAESLMVPQLQGTDMESVIRELATRMEEEHFVDSAEKLVELALRREAVVSTVVDHGLAFPHVRGVEGGGLTMALGTSSKGLKLDGNDAGPTRMVFFMVIPTAASAFYLKLLAGLTETFRKPEARKALLGEKTAAGMWKTLCKTTRASIK